MFTRITSLAGALAAATVVLTGGAILRGGEAAADPNQDERFLALLEEADIPALANVPSVIAAAHKVCRKLDGGMPVDDLVDEMRNNSYNKNPVERLFPPARVTSTMTRFITAAVDVYCPYDQSKIASIGVNPAPGSDEPMRPVAAYTHHVVNSGRDPRQPSPALSMINIPVAGQEQMGVVRAPHLMAGGVSVAGRYGDGRSDCDVHGCVLTSLIDTFPSGEIISPNPPQIPAPLPPAAQIPAPPPPIAPPPPRKQPPPPPQQEEPPAAAPPQQEEPPAAAAPQQEEEPPAAAAPPSGGAGGSAGTGGIGGTGGNADNGGNGGDDADEPMAPGWIKLAP
jgi:outer membrane biosynthesis protein TonB